MTNFTAIIFLAVGSIALATGHNPPVTSGMLFACSAVILFAIGKMTP